MSGEGVARVSAWLSRFVSGVSGGVSRWGHLRLAVVLVAIVVPMLALTASADERSGSVAEELSSVAPSIPAGIDPESLPLAGGRGMEELKEAARLEKERVEKRKQELASPVARERRERSRTAHVGLVDAAAERLASQTFGQLLTGAKLGIGLEQLAAGRAVREFVDDHTVVLEGHGDRPPVLLESPWPLRAEGDDGRKHAVDLSLQAEEGGFEPVNAAADVRLPIELSHGVTVGQVGVVPEGSSTGVPVSEGGNDWVFYGNAQIDTDVVVTPVARGAEVFWQLRSPRAAEELSLDLQLPAGAVVEETDTGSAVVILDGKEMIRVTPPVAVDAEGQDVPVEMVVEPERLVISVKHRGTDVAYPLMVDPVIEDYWLSTGSWIDQSDAALNRLDHWFPVHGGEPYGYYIQRLHCYAPVSCDGAINSPGYDYNKPDGLHIYVQHNPEWYVAGSYAEWVYAAPGDTTRVEEVGMYGFYHRRGGSQEPFMYTGVWSHALGDWASVDVKTQDINGQTIQHFAGGAPGPQQVAFGFATGQDVMNGWWRDGYIGAAIIALTDPEAPLITGPSLYRLQPPATPGQPHVWAGRSGWFRRSDQLAVRARISDPGLGVSRAEFSGAGVWDSFNLGCVGNYSALCPESLAGNEANQMVTSLENTSEGISTAHIHAWDPLGHQSSVPVTLKVDDTRPTIDLSGNLWTFRETVAGSGIPVLGTGTYSMTMTAQDPAPSGAPGVATSGVEKLEVLLDGDVVATDAGACAQDCSRTFSWALDTALHSGKRTIRVRATDGAGNVASKAFVVNLPTRGEMVLPVDGESTSSRLALLAEAREDGFSGVEFQYREMPSGLWKTIGGTGTMLRDDQGNVVSSTSHALDQPGRRTKKLIWDARTAIDLAMLTPKPGPLQVRAVFSGNGGTPARPSTWSWTRRVCRPAMLRPRSGRGAWTS